MVLLLSNVLPSFTVSGGHADPSNSTCLHINQDVLALFPLRPVISIHTGGGWQEPSPFCPFVPLRLMMPLKHFSIL